MVEDPTYYLIERIFQDHGLKVVGVPTDDYGLDTDALELMLASGVRPRLLCVIPTYQNPNGSVLLLERRKRLVQLARKFGFTVLADEVYQLLHHGPAPPPPVDMLDDGDGEFIVSLSSFSKILAPGLRLGWVHGSPGVIRRFTESGVAASGGGLSNFAAAVAHSVLETGLLSDNVDNLRWVFGQRRDMVAVTLRDELGDWVNFTAPGGGCIFLAEVTTGYRCRCSVAVRS